MCDGLEMIEGRYQNPSSISLLWSLDLCFVCLLYAALNLFKDFREIIRLIPCHCILISCNITSTNFAYLNGCSLDDSHGQSILQAPPASCHCITASESMGRINICYVLPVRYFGLCTSHVFQMELSTWHHESTAVVKEISEATLFSFEKTWSSLLQHLLKIVWAYDQSIHLSMDWHWNSSTQYSLQLFSLQLVRPGGLEPLKDACIQELVVGILLHWMTLSPPIFEKWHCFVIHNLEVVT